MNISVLCLGIYECEKKKHISYIYIYLYIYEMIKKHENELSCRMQ